MRNYTEHSKEVKKTYTAEWNKIVDQVTIKFKPSDKSYFDKWRSLPGKTNIEKIKSLLDLV